MTIRRLALNEATRLAVSGCADDIDRLLEHLDERASFADCKVIDYALGLVESLEGRQQIRHYLFAGSPIQRNYAALFFKRRRAVEILEDAVACGCIDVVQAYAR